MRKKDYRPVIGLEIHVELKTNSKMFCDCANDPLEKHPNINVCPICLGHPGVLPVINGNAVKMVIKTGLALGCQIQEYSKFDRKNYFYPDLPKGYQISQYDKPLCKGGYLEIGKSDFPETPGVDGKTPGVKAGKSDFPISKIRIRRIHLEEDTGRLVHPAQEGRGSLNKIERPKGADYSLVDFNRAGVPLMELVTEPDLSSAEEASQFAEELQLILRYLGVSDADMEKGEMRVEVNISLNPKSLPCRQAGKIPALPAGRQNPKQKLGTKVEIKNLNSFRAVERAIDYEIERQSEILELGEKIIQETRGWDDVKGKTFSQRIKEGAKDYRYFPEPDLPPLHFTNEDIKKIQAEILEFPQQRRERFKKEYGLGSKETEVFIRNKDLGEYFEKAVSELGAPGLIKLCSNYILTDLQGLLRGASITDENFRITPENFAEFIKFIGDGKLSSKLAKEVLAEMFSTGAEPDHIIKEKGLVQITDASELEEIVKKVILDNPNAANDYKKGKENSLQFLVGQIMAQTQGKANPQIARQLLLTKLK